MMSIFYVASFTRAQFLLFFVTMQPPRSIKTVRRIELLNWTSVKMPYRPIVNNHYNHSKYVCKTAKTYRIKQFFSNFIKLRMFSFRYTSGVCKTILS